MLAVVHTDKGSDKTTTLHQQLEHYHHVSVGSTVYIYTISMFNLASLVSMCMFNLQCVCVCVLCLCTCVRM